MNKHSYTFSGTSSLLLVFAVGFIMAGSADLRSAIGTGVAALAAMLLSTAIITVLKKIIPPGGKLPVSLLVVTGVVSLILMLMQAYFPYVVSATGMHLAALSVTLCVFCENKNGKGTVAEFSMNKAVITSVYFIIIMAVTALIREFFGRASIWGKPIGFMADYKISALAGVFGGYIVLAIVLASIKKIFACKSKEKEDK